MNMKLKLIAVTLLASSSVLAQSASDTQRGFLDKKDDAHDHGYYSEEPNINSIQRNWQDSYRHDVEDYSEPNTANSIIQKNLSPNRDDAHDSPYSRNSPYGSKKNDDSKDW